MRLYSSKFSTKQKQSMKSKTLNGLLCLLVITVVSCVSPQQYDTLLQENEFLEEENNVLREEVSIKEEASLVETKLEADVIRLESDLRDYQKRYASLEKTYQELSIRYKVILTEKGSSASATSNADCQVALDDLKRSMDKQSREMRIIQLTLQERESQIKDLERLLHANQFSN